MVRLPDGVYAMSVDGFLDLITNDGPDEPLKEWLGTPPSSCDICRKPIIDSFIDGRTVHGPWANMCPTCFKREGVGLGTGHGQHYGMTPTGGFVKIGG